MLKLLLTCTAFLAAGDCGMQDCVCEATMDWRLALCVCPRQTQAVYDTMAVCKLLASVSCNISVVFDESIFH